MQGVVMMDPDCAELLPLVCEVLANPDRALPDDTCLEKLLDWFAALTNKAPGLSLLELNPCLVSFISSVCTSKSAEPSVLAFALKLAGLLASNERAFPLLKEEGIMKNAFEYQGWMESSVWEDATVRSGWIHGLQNVLKHWQAMQFVLENGLLKAILRLQSDRSLFVASATNQLLACILTFPTSPAGHLSVKEARTTERKNERNACCGHDSPERNEGAAQIVEHVEESLTSRVPFRAHQSLKLIALSLTGCQPHVREVLWQKTVEAKEMLMGNGQSSLVQPFLEVLRAAARTHLFTEGNFGVVTLMDDVLCSLKPMLAVPFATGIIHLDNCGTSELLGLESLHVFPMLKKRLCDVRWEVRDSSLEFLTHLTLQLQEDLSYCETLSSSGIWDFLMALLNDPESYVRASAICALGQMAYVTCPVKGPPSGSSVQEELFVHFVEILAQDTEGFARRAVIKVFSYWLRHPPLQPLKKMEKHLGTVFQLGSDDLDWEVKVHTLELAQIVIDEILETSSQTSCPYSIIPSARCKGRDLTESLRKLHHLMIFNTLFSGLLDCDRPVAQQACRILLDLKEVIIDHTDIVDKTVVFDLQGCKWGQDILKKHFEKHSITTAIQVCVDIEELLQSLDLEGRQRALEKSSDHMENSPRSLMQDILAAAHTVEENIVDCY
ncbi:BRCA1-associated ATM activator 1-like [Scleropages formosus]|uniref:BRCA1-associated ATM activator 1-like n=1 Tax=Scleropages formosus TaxID=113540 RepID=A0A0P7X5V1_SCLFO|nr:BRCA1-associated ATM activator 1-like [Scleropages formosus]